MADTEGLFYLKDDEIEFPSENGDAFGDHISEEDEEDGMSSGDEDLATMAANIAIEKKLNSGSCVYTGEPKTKDFSQSVCGGEVIEDFVRNYLVKMGLMQTLHSFQTEWYELLIREKLSGQRKQSVPDVYTQNQMLVEKSEELKQQLNGYKEAARLAKEKYVRLKKERDFHRMHHRRTAQEKDKLIAEIKRLKDHFSSYEPMLTTLKTKYEIATRDKMLTKLERDKAMAELECLHSTLYSLRPSSHPPPNPGGRTLNNNGNRSLPLPPIGGQQQQQSLPPNNKLRSLPCDVANPYTSSSQPLCAHLSRVGGLQLTGTINAHKYPISSLSLHPTKNILVTGSDDHTWRLWAVPGGELLMTGEGHEDWVAGVRFHPSGDLLASCGGDGVVKVWDFAKMSSVLSLEDHSQPVWDCSWHWTGDILASCGMDNTTRIWDIESLKCLSTLRGHTDSVNSVCFIPCSNTLVTCSADKTVLMWDTRTGLCTHTMTGHENSCNAVTSNWQSTQIYSADCFGFVMVWDVRGGELLNTWDVGPHPVNGINIDRAGSVLACASGSGHMCMINTATTAVSKLQSSDHDSVEDVCYGHNSDIMYSIGANGMISVWQ